MVTSVSAVRTNEIFGAFGLAVEDYACDILRRMYPSAHGNDLVNRLECRVRLTDAPNDRDQAPELDAVLNDIVELVLIEIKAEWIREDRILVGEGEGLLEHLRSKYSEASQTDERKKGVAQLAEAVKRFASQTWTASGSRSSVKRVFAVLVTYDHLLSAPVYTHVLNQDFRDFLSPVDDHASGDFLKDGIRIAPLAIMTIDDLEDLETAVRQFSLRELLADYAHQCPDRLVSLRNFIALSGRHLRHNPVTSGWAAEILGVSLSRIFGKSPDNTP